MTTAIACVLVLLLLPIIVLMWATESRSTRITRLKRTHTWRQIATRYSVSPSTVRRWSIAS